MVEIINKLLHVRTSLVNDYQVIQINYILDTKIFLRRVSLFLNKISKFEIWLGDIFETIHFNEINYS